MCVFNCMDFECRSHVNWVPKYMTLAPKVDTLAHLLDGLLKLGWFYKLALLDFELIFEVKMQEREGV